MIKNQKYTLNKINNSNGTFQHNSKLYAELRFKNEVAPKDRNAIRKRLKKNDRRYGTLNLRDYMTSSAP